MVEKSVHTAKQLPKKAKLEKIHPYMSLLEYRNTPLDAFALPAQMSGSLRSIPLTTGNHLRPNFVDLELARERMEQKRATQRHY